MSSKQGIPSPQSAPGAQSSWTEILDEFPELADDVAALTGWRDTGTYDRHSKSFEKQFPSLKPNVTGEP